MNRTNTTTAKFFAPLAIALVAAFSSIGAHADLHTPPVVIVSENDGECFPACKPTEAMDRIEIKAAELPAAPAASCNSSTQTLVNQAENLNDRIKSIKELIGYARSPQGLAMKLVNDNLVKIPAWVGYAIDPVGSIKNRAIDEVRTRAKSAIGLKRNDAACIADAATELVEGAPLPIDTNQI